MEVFKIELEWFVVFKIWRLLFLFEIFLGKKSDCVGKLIFYTENMVDLLIFCYCLIDSKIDVVDPVNNTDEFGFTIFKSFNTFSLKFP